MPDILKTLEQHLPDWNPKYQPAGGAEKLPHLFVQVGGIMGALAQISTAQKITGSDLVQDGVDIMQMFFEMPFEMNPQFFDETAMLLSNINSRIPILGFVANATKHTVAFRYMHLFNPDNPNYLLIDEALSNIDIIFDLYRDAIQAVATGDKSYEVIVKTIP